jgi:hypothetical protein
MKTRCQSIFRAAYHTFDRAVFAGAVLLIASSTQAQNLFMLDGVGRIYEITPGGVQSIFASGLLVPDELAFNSAGDLFAADYANAGDLFVGSTSDGDIVKITPGGAQSTFASGVGTLYGMAFNNVGDLFVADASSGNIYKFTPGGAKSTFISGLSSPLALAFNSAGDLFEADAGSGNIYEFTPGGAKSTFASGLNGPIGLAFNNVGDLFEADYSSDNIYEFAPDGAKSTFASGLEPCGLAFQPVPEPSALELLAVGLTALLVRRRKLLDA